MYFLYFLYWNIGPSCLGVWVHATVFNIIKTRFFFWIKFNTTYNISKETWFFPNRNECSQAEILLTSIAKLTISETQVKNVSLSLSHFLNTLRLEVEKERNAALHNKTLNMCKEKWGDLELIISLGNQGTKQVKI